QTIHDVMFGKPEPCFGRIQDRTESDRTAVHQDDTPVHASLKILPLDDSEHEEQHDRENGDRRHADPVAEVNPCANGADHEKPKELFFHDKASAIANLLFYGGIGFRDCFDVYSK